MVGQVYRCLPKDNEVCVGEVLRPVGRQDLDGEILGEGSISSTSGLIGAPLARSSDAG